MHGYVSNAGIFYKVIQNLKHTFNITAIDLLGVAGSGRPRFEISCTKKTIHFFTLSIESWMQATGYREHGGYTLLGHSIGGYISTNFVLEFPEKLDRLILLSVNGIQEKEPEVTLGYSVLENFWHSRVVESLLSAPRKLGYYGFLSCTSFLAKTFGV